MGATLKAEDLAQSGEPVVIGCEEVIDAPARHRSCKGRRPRMAVVVRWAEEE